MGHHQQDNATFLQQLLVLADAPENYTLRYDHFDFTDDVASVLGKVLRAVDSVVDLTLLITPRFQLTPTGSYQDLLDYLSTNSKLRSLYLLGFMVPRSPSMTAVLQRIIEAVSQSSSIQSLSLGGVEVPIDSLQSLSHLVTLKTHNCSIIGTEDTAVEASGSSTASQMNKLVCVHCDEPTLKQLPTLLKVHQKIKQLLIGYKEGEQFNQATIIEMLQEKKHLDMLVVDFRHHVLSCATKVFNVLNKDMPTTVSAVVCKFTDPGNQVLLDDGEKSKLIDAMKRTTVLVFGVEANRDSIFNQEEQDVISRIEMRNRHLPSVMRSGARCRGLWPQLFHVAAQSGHARHSALTAEILFHRHDTFGPSSVKSENDELDA